MVKRVALGIVGVLALIVVVILGIAETKPKTFHLERTATIDAPAARIFPLINDFHHWSEWSPFDKMDPNMQRTFSGPTQGLGAQYAWSGNGQAGEGHMEIVKAATPSQVLIDLNFTKPMKAHNTATFTLKEHGGKTDVTWAMDGRMHLINRVFSIFFDMDKMVGGEFEKGLNNLKADTEKK